MDVRVRYALEGCPNRTVGQRNITTNAHNIRRLRPNQSELILNGHGENGGWALNLVIFFALKLLQ